jgi:hypothetical protein
VVTHWRCRVADHQLDLREAAMLVEVQKQNKAYRVFQELLVQQIRLSFSRCRLPSSSPADRNVWLACGEESRNLGLPEITQFGEQRRLEIIDHYIYYCRRSKLPHLY